MNLGQVSPALFSVFSVATIAVAGTGGYEVSRYTVDGGGVTSSSGAAYELSGTVAQPEAGGSLSGGSYTLTGGFWRPAATAGDIPTLSTWGTVGMALIILTAGTLICRWRRPILFPNHFMRGE